MIVGKSVKCAGCGKRRTCHHEISIRGRDVHSVAGFCRECWRLWDAHPHEMWRTFMRLHREAGGRI